MPVSIGVSESTGSAWDHVNTNVCVLCALPIVRNFQMSMSIVVRKQWEDNGNCFKHLFVRIDSLFPDNFYNWVVWFDHVTCVQLVPMNCFEVQLHVGFVRKQFLTLRAADRLR